ARERFERMGLGEQRRKIVAASRGRWRGCCRQRRRNPPSSGTTPRRRWWWGGGGRWRSHRRGVRGGRVRDPERKCPLVLALRHPDDAERERGRDGGGPRGASRPGPRRECTHPSGAPALSNKYRRRRSTFTPTWVPTRTSAKPGTRATSGWPPAFRCINVSLPSGSTTSTSALPTPLSAALNATYSGRIPTWSSPS